MALMPVDDALNAILKDAAPLGEEMVALDDALHRVLAQDIAARRTQPPEAMSAMDGYAVRASDATLGARLTVIGEVAAGRPFDRAIGAGEAARIFTGGVVPQGADAIVIQEDTARDGDVVIVNEAAKANRHIRGAGIDFREGDVLLKHGRLVIDRDLSLAASMNHAQLPVRKRPKVALLATGDELVMPGSSPGPGQIVYSNGYGLRALARNEGAQTIDLGIAADTMDATTAAIRRARELGVDILITTGGASVGDHDVVKRSLEAEGTAISFWKIALRPGKLMMHGRLGAMRVIGLPGNPVSSYVCAFLFMVPLLRALLGRSDVRHIGEHAVLGRDLAANDEREEYMRAHLSTGENGAIVATPVTQQDSSLSAHLSAANGLVIRPPHAPPAGKGSACVILKLPV
ncbi:MAG: molybdopterin molybdenumtransferase MoeA [Proteobacteria bacterium SG_bin9]|nr:MAG: molybdopterin molybdenumtransferase MoeA [Proteobacteria bacterium SG_bin9]